MHSKSTHRKGPTRMMHRANVLEMSQSEESPTDSNFNFAAITIQSAFHFRLTRPPSNKFKSPTISSYINSSSKNFWQSSTSSNSSCFCGLNLLQCFKRRPFKIFQSAHHLLDLLTHGKQTQLNNELTTALSQEIQVVIIHLIHIK